ncbi:hypothetical protein [Asticcacaulis sp. AND118]|uniref:hypothetical protein n=1 Tax=Asticcacaulis sp. AND118 TaxID=2840468 RepID=UPI001CFFBA9D|nr:hypothetical protein [Asticcacaulis sp. AND118]UDF03921.1 hypothetical protein LH365_02450 [Asticcacaulis sp. AND118]
MDFAVYGVLSARILHAMAKICWKVSFATKENRLPMQQYGNRLQIILDQYVFLWKHKDLDFVYALAGRWLRHLGRRRNGGLSGMIPSEIIPL